MQPHTVKAKLEEDGVLVLRELPFARGDEVEVRLVEPARSASSLPPLPDGFDQLTPREQSDVVRERLRGSITFADDYDPSEPACPPEDWHALDPTYDGL